MQEIIERKVIVPGVSVFIGTGQRTRTEDWVSTAPGFARFTRASVRLSARRLASTSGSGNHPQKGEVACNNARQNVSGRA